MPCPDGASCEIHGQWQVEPDAGGCWVATLLPPFGDRGGRSHRWTSGLGGAEGHTAEGGLVGGLQRGLGNPRPELAGLGCLGPKECLVARARAQAAREALTQPCPPSPPSIPPLHVSALATHSHKTVTTAMTTTFPGSLAPPLPGAVLASPAHLTHQHLTPRAPRAASSQRRGAHSGPRSSPTLQGGASPSSAWRWGGVGSWTP